jgi:hypothetical protein
MCAVDEDDDNSPEPEPWRIDMGPLLRGLSAEPLELELARRRLLREIQDSITRAKRRIEDALVNAPVDDWLDVAGVCAGLTQDPAEAALAQLEASRRVELDRGRVRRGPAFSK